MEYQSSFQKIVAFTENELQENDNVSPQKIQNLDMEKSELEPVQQGKDAAELELPRRGGDDGLPRGGDDGQLELKLGDEKAEGRHWLHKLMFVLIFGAILGLLIVVAITHPSHRWASHLIVGPKKFP